MKNLENVGVQYLDTLLHSNFTSLYRVHPETLQALAFNIKRTVISKNSDGCSKWKVVDSSRARPFLQTTLVNIYQYQFNNPTLYFILCLLALVCWEKTGQAEYLLKPTWKMSLSLDLIGGLYSGIRFNRKFITEILCSCGSRTKTTTGNPCL